jgi:hypothetical protein
MKIGTRLAVLASGAFLALGLGAGAANAAVTSGHGGPQGGQNQWCQQDNNNHGQHGQQDGQQGRNSHDGGNDHQQGDGRGCGNGNDRGCQLFSLPVFHTTSYIPGVGGGYGNRDHGNQGCQVCRNVTTWVKVTDWERHGRHWEKHIYWVKNTTRDCGHNGSGDGNHGNGPGGGGGDGHSGNQHGCTVVSFTADVASGVFSENSNTPILHNGDRIQDGAYQGTVANWNGAANPHTFTLTGVSQANGHHVQLATVCPNHSIA